MAERTFALRHKWVTPNASTGTFDVTWDDCSGMNAKGVEVLYIDAGSYDNVADRAWSRGFSDGTTTIHIGTHDEDEADPTNIHYCYSSTTDLIVRAPDGGSAYIFQCEFDSFIDGGVRLDITEFSSAAGRKMLVMCWFGTEVEVDVQEDQLTTTNNRTITTGFEANYIRTFAPYSTSSSFRSKTDAWLSEGVATWDGTTLKQWAHGFRMETNEATTKTLTGNIIDGIMYQPWWGSNTTGYVSDVVVSVSSTYFTCNSRGENPSDGRRCAYMSIKLPDDVGINMYSGGWMRNTVGISSWVTGLSDSKYLHCYISNNGAMPDWDATGSEAIANSNFTFHDASGGDGDNKGSMSVTHLDNEANSKGRSCWYTSGAAKTWLYDYTGTTCYLTLINDGANVQNNATYAHANSYANRLAFVVIQDGELLSSGLPVRHKLYRRPGAQLIAR